MDVVFLQKVGHCAGDLALKIIHNDECWSVIFETVSGVVYVGYDYIPDVLDCSSFIGPALWRMCDIPV